MKYFRLAVKSIRLWHNCVITKSFIKSQFKVKSSFLPSLCWSKMTLPKALRHVQTQHSDDSADLENIFLFRADINCRNDVVVTTDANTSSLTEADAVAAGAGSEVATETTDVTKAAVDDGADETVETAKSEQENFQNGVWTYEVTEEVSQIATISADSPTQLPEKRKAPPLIESVEPKKPKLETKELKATRPGFSEERYDETSYYIENGLRKVYPYFFTFTTFTKGRWIGEKILDVFSREFRAHPADEYKRSIEAGTLQVNNEKVPIDYKLKHNDLLANTVHRHEVPVTAQSFKIVHMDEHILVVNKPASIPVHPCGRYRHNTAIFILAKEFNLRNLRTIHRLDRLTSGLLLFGRTSEKAREMEQQIRNRQVQKEYVCCVEGSFPDGIIECNEPIEVVSYKIGVCRVSSKGKDCKTTFKKISQTGNYSIVQCKPLTGRMHQIRVHLQYLGYPIVNDPLYNHEVFGPLKGKGGDIGGKSDEQLIKDLITIHNAENWLGTEGDVDVMPKNLVDGPSSGNTEHVLTTTIDEGHQLENTVSTQTGYDSPDLRFDSKKLTTDPHCCECKINYRDPKPEDLVMYLHAWKYKGCGWAYETELPSWATMDDRNSELKLRTK